MKIAVVLNTSWNIYNFRMGLIKHLQKEGAQIYAIAPYDNFTQHLVEEGCTYVPLKMDSRGANPIKDLALTAELYRIYKKIRPDIILHFTIKPNIYGSFAASLLKIPVINNVSGLGTVFLNDNVVSQIALKMYRRAFKHPQKVFFQNTDDKKLFLQKQLVREEISQVIPGSGIAVGKFKVAPPTSNHQFTFLLISRLILDKGILEYIEAIKILKSQGIKARFQLLGAKDPAHKRGIDPAEVDLWHDEGLIEYLGTTADVRPYIAKADCVVLPSYREGTPRTLLEAACCGRPIVATDVPGCTNIVENGYNGLLCKVKDAKDLAQKLHQMMTLSQEERMKMGQNGRKKVSDEFDESLVIDHYQRAISKIISKKLEIVN